MVLEDALNLQIKLPVYDGPSAIVDAKGPQHLGHYGLVGLLQGLEILQEGGHLNAFQQRWQLIVLVIRISLAGLLSAQDLQVRYLILLAHLFQALVLRPQLVNCG